MEFFLDLLQLRPNACRSFSDTETLRVYGLLMYRRSLYDTNPAVCEMVSGCYQFSRERNAEAPLVPRRKVMQLYESLKGSAFEPVFAAFFDETCSALFSTQ